MKEWPDWDLSSQAIQVRAKGPSALPLLPVATKTRGVTFPQHGGVRLKLRSRLLRALRVPELLQDRASRKNKHRRQKVTEVVFDAGCNVLETFYIRICRKELVKKKKEEVMVVVGLIQQIHKTRNASLQKTLSYSCRQKRSLLDHTGSGELKRLDKPAGA